MQFILTRYLSLSSTLYIFILSHSMGFFLNKDNDAYMPQSRVLGEHLTGINNLRTTNTGRKMAMTTHCKAPISRKGEEREGLEH